MYPQSTFRRYGNAEQAYGGSMGLTPPGTPPRTRNSSPRSVSRRRSRDDDDEPSARRDPPQRERSRERETSATSMPAEWGARTLKVEKQLQECVEEIKKLQAANAELQTAMTQMNTKKHGDSVRLNALEQALPKRVHKCKEQQNNHVGIMSEFAQRVSEQIASLQHRMNTVENAQAQVPTFG